jgi:tetratricopeptide (TPR) repeat protein
LTLNATEQREKAAVILQRDLEISNDPMFYNVQGRNYHEMGKFDKAETSFRNSTYLLPERIYPYYLLTFAVCRLRQLSTRKNATNGSHCARKRTKSTFCGN